MTCREVVSLWLDPVVVILPDSVSPWQNEVLKMATEITMPKLSDTMTEGRLISWKKSVGEKVNRGDIIAEVETDKANMELEAFVSGVLLETRVKPGEMVPVGTTIAIVGEAGEAVQIPEKVVAAPLPEPEK